MTITAKSRLYIGVISALFVLVVTATIFMWPEHANDVSPSTIVFIVLLIAIAGRFPIKLSSHADASLSVVPVFMAILLLHPTQAALVAALGVLTSERLLKSQIHVTAFNVAVIGLASGAASMVWYSLRPEHAVLQLTSAEMLAAGAAGLTLLVFDVVSVIGMVTIRSKVQFWTTWRGLYAFEAVQEGGQLALGLIAALLVTQAWWGIVILVVPAVLAYYGFQRTVNDAAEKVRMADELGQSLEELKSLQAQLVQSARLASVGTLAAGVAHEINNPVFAIAGRAELLLRGGQKHLASQTAVEYTETIQDMATRITGIVRQLLDYARPKTDTTDVGLVDTIENAIGLLGEHSTAVGSVFDKEFRDHPIVRGVDNQLQQVFVNVILNAIYATSEKGRIKLITRIEGAFAIATVSDSGTGMPDELVSRIFEPFVTTKDPGKGTGLGLFICHSIIQSHGGEITIDSREGHGTTVSISLPLAPVQLHPQPLLHRVSSINSSTADVSANKKYEVAGV